MFTEPNYKLDAIEKAPCSIHLRWSRADGKTGKLSAGKQLGLVLLESLVGKDYGVQID